MTKKYLNFLKKIFFFVLRPTSIWKVRMTSDLESWVRWGSSVSSPRLRELCDLLSIELRLLKCTAMSRPWAAANTDIIVQLQAEECVMYKKRESERNTFINFDFSLTH